MEEEVEKNPEEELFVKLADAIGESPEEVWRMSDVERRQLIEVLGLEIKGGAARPASSCFAETLVDADVGAINVQNCAIIEEVESMEEKDDDRAHEEEVSKRRSQAPNTEEDFEVITAKKDFEGISPMEKQLKEDTNKVKKLLAGTHNETIEMDVLEAYLQAHANKPDRVRVVLEELAGVGDLADVETEGPIIIVDEEVPSTEKGKGKGKGKSTMMKRGAFLFESEDTAREAKHRKLEGGEQNELETVSNAVFNVDTNLSVIEVADNQQHTSPFRDSSANLQHMHQDERLLVDDEENSNLINHAPGSNGKQKSEVKPSLALKNIEDLVEGPNGNPKQPELEPDARSTSIEEAPVLKEKGEASAQLAEHGAPNVAEVKHDNTGREGKEAQKVLASQQEARKPPMYSSEVRVLAGSLSEMFSATPVSYLLHRCGDLVDNPAAIERFTEELLLDPNPPPYWQQQLVGVPVEDEALPVAGPSSGLNRSLNLLEVWEGERFDQLKSMFPDVCPEHLLSRVQGISAAKERVGEEVTGADNKSFEQLVENLWNTLKTLPSRKEYEARRKEQMEVENWAGAMTAARFLQLYPDPKEHFTGGDRDKVITAPGYLEHALSDLLQRFPYQAKNRVSSALNRFKLYIPAAKYLQRQEASRKTRRTAFEIPKPRKTVCLEFLKEKKYLELENEIAQMKLDKVKEQARLIEEARAAGLLVECEVCYKDDCLEQEMVPCKANHLHCAECIAQAAKVAAGENKTGVTCPTCDEEVEYKHLDKVVDPIVLSKMLQRRQAEEVSGAGLEGLVKCPFCHYCTVMENPEDKVLVCRNPDCGRESCRLCKESNHVPLRCEEVEKTEGTRKEIEEKLTEAMIRECWKCSKKVTCLFLLLKALSFTISYFKFFKEEGCNKMTCTCGAKMCYICKAKGVDYDHFYGQVMFILLMHLSQARCTLVLQGGEATAKRTCPLWSDNKAIHEEELAKAAEEARQKLEQDKITLDIDPLKGIAKPAAQQSIEEIREQLFQRWYSVKAEVRIGIMNTSIQFRKQKNMISISDVIT